MVKKADAGRNEVSGGTCNICTGWSRKNHTNFNVL